MVFFSSYEEQLQRKMEEVTNLVKRLGSEISRANPGLAGVVRSRQAEQQGCIKFLIPHSRGGEGSLSSLLGKNIKL